MMIHTHTIRNRLGALENARKKEEIPELIMVFWDEEKQSWTAQEHYIKRNSKGKIISGTQRIKKLFLNDSAEYKPPEGFKGTMIDGRVFD